MGESARRRGEALAAAGDADAAKWLAGAAGERRVAQALEELPATWTVIHDRLLMPGLTESNLDHVVIGPAGVVLVDAKNFSGDISVWGDTLFQHLGSGESRTSRNLVAELRKVHWMAARAGERLSMPVTPVLCLAGNRQGRFGEPRLVAGVWVVPVEAVAAFLASMPTRVTDPLTVARIVPRVMSEFPSTSTDPELLAAIGRDLGRMSPPRVRARDTSRPPVRVKRRHPLVALVWLVVLVALFLSGLPLLVGIGQQLGSVYAERISSAPTPIVTQSAPVMERTAEETQSQQPSCDALSAETLTTYLKVRVSAAHAPDGHCAWITDPSDLTSVVVRVRWLEAYAVAYLTDAAPRVSESYDAAARSRTSVLSARPGQLIPVADTRTEARWPMRVTIMRDPLDITHERADQILRAVAADLNSDAVP